MFSNSYSRNVKTVGYTRGGNTSEINLEQRGNSTVMSKKPATESSGAQGILFSEEVLFPDQKVLFPGFCSFCTFRPTPGLYREESPFWAGITG